MAWSIDLANASEYKKRIMPLLLAHPGLVKSVAVTAHVLHPRWLYGCCIPTWSYPYYPFEHSGVRCSKSPREGLCVYNTVSKKSRPFFIIVGRVMDAYLLFIGWRSVSFRPKENRAKEYFYTSAHRPWRHHIVGLRKRHDSVP